MLGANAAGLKSKLTSFRKVLTSLQPSVFFIEETKYKDVGKLKVENYVIFELTRKNKDGGGLALGCSKDLQPVLLREGDDNVEALSVEIFVKDMRIRCCIAYGCQENETVERKDAFWTFLEEEVLEAEICETGFILHFDGNLWAGKNIIPGDPRPQNKNGKLFQEFLERNPQLSVVNALPLCKGLVTRKRISKGKHEESVLDFFLVCHRVLPYVSKMVIDESKEHILTNYQSARYGGSAKDSDHFTQYMDINLKIISEKPERVEFFNFKDEKSQQIFQKLTSETEDFTKCFQDNASLDVQVENWRKALNSHCKKAFKKIRIRKKALKPVNPIISKLIDQRNTLSKEENNKSKVKAIEEEIAIKEAEVNRDKIVKNFKKLSENPDNINMKHMWKMLKSLWPKQTGILPTAKRNHRGKIVTSSKEIKKMFNLKNIRTI